MPERFDGATKYDEINKRTAVVPRVMEYKMNSKTMNVLVISNLFLGAPFVDEDKVKETLKGYVEAVKKSPNTVVFILGNLLERYSTIAGLKEHEELILRDETLTPLSDFRSPLQKELVEILKPISHKIAGVVRGKQEFEVFYSPLRYDPLKAIVKDLKIEDRYAPDTFLLTLSNKDDEKIKIYGTNGGAESVSIKSRKTKQIYSLMGDMIKTAETEYGFCDWYISTASDAFLHIDDAAEFLRNGEKMKKGLDRNILENKTRRFTCVNGWVNYSGSGLTSQNIDTSTDNHKIYRWEIKNGVPFLDRDYFNPEIKTNKPSTRTR